MYGYPHVLQAKQDGNSGHNPGSLKKRATHDYTYVMLAEAVQNRGSTPQVNAPQFSVFLKSGSDWCC